MDVTLILIWIAVFLLYFVIKKFIAKLREFEAMEVPFVGPWDSLVNFLRVMTMRVHFIDNMEKIYEEHKKDK